MKQKIIPAVILSGVIILVCAFHFLLFTTRTATTDERETPYTTTYTLEKINQINDKIIERDIIEDTYFYFLGDDPDLLEDIKQYNESTGLLADDFMVDALDISISLYQDMTASETDYYAYNALSNYLDFPPEIREFQEIIAHAALYRNCAELLYANPKLAYFLGRGRGGSLGMWPKTFQNEDGSFEKLLRADLAAYFDLIDGLMVRLEERRNTVLSQD